MRVSDAGVISAVVPVRALRVGAIALCGFSVRVGEEVLGDG